MLTLLSLICENISLLITAIKRSMQRSNLTVPPMFEDAEPASLGLLTLCHSSLHLTECLERKCNHCGVFKVGDLLCSWVQDSPDDLVKWLTWKLVETNVKGKSIKRLTKVACENRRQDLCKILLSKLDTYGLHSFIAKSQSKAYQQCLKTLKPNECCVVVDFAENYTCIRQNEAQTAYYSRNQVTLHPMVITKQRDGTNCVSVCVLTDDMTHDASATYVFINILFDHLKCYHPEINSIHIWSDGCAAQYKSKLPFFHISQAFNRGAEYDLTWNFFGSRHGKCSADGEAGVVKTFLTQEATQTNIILDNAYQVYNHLVASELYRPTGSSQRHFYLVSNLDMEKQRQHVRDVSTVVGTRRLHQIIPGHATRSIRFRDLSCFCSQFPCFHADNAWKSHRFPGNGYIF